MMKLFYASLLTAWTGVSLAYAQDKTIQGTVQDAESNRFLADATISYNHQTKHSHSSSNGSFYLQIDAFPDTLVISRIGYETLKYPITGPVGHLNIKLQHKEIQLDQISVSAQDFRKNISKVDLDKIPVNTAQDLLRKVPGLFIAQHAGGGKAEQIFLRGFDNDHGTDIAIFADGMPVNIVSHAHGQGYADLHFIIPETVKDIDFGKGAYYADKGDLNTSGYVSFSTKDYLEKNLFKVEGGSFDTYRAVAMVNLLHADERDRNAYVAGEFNYSNGPFDVKQNFNRVNLFGKYNQWISKNQYINFQGSIFSSGWNASGQIPERAVKEGIISRWGSIDPTEGGSTSRANLSMNYKATLSDHQDWETLVYFSRYKFKLYSDFTFFLKDPIHGDEIEQSDDRYLYGMENKYNHKFNFDNSHMNWTSGFGFRADDIKDLQLNHVYHRDSLINPLSHISGFELNMHAFSNLDWHIGKWTINPGVRIDHFTFNMHDRLNITPASKDAAATRVSPKLNFAYDASPRMQYYLKGGMGFHSNDMRVVIAQGGKQILPFSVGGDLGLIWKPTDKLLIQPAIWAMYLQQEFVYVGDEAVVEPSGKTKRLGADLGIRYQIIPSLYFDGDVNYAFARYIDEPKGENYIPLVPALTSTAGLSLKLPNGFSANYRYRYMDTKPAIEDNSVRAKGYFISDLLLGYALEQWNFNVQIQNLFNQKWNEAQFETETQLHGEAAPVSELHFTPGTPFMIKAGVSLKF